MLINLTIHITTASHNESGWRRPQWVIWSSLPAQAESQQSTWHRTASRHFWNTSSEGEPPWAICSSACSLLLQQLLFIFTGTSCLSVSAHRLLSYCFTQFGRAWKHPLTPSDSYTHFLYTLMEALLSHLFLDLNRLNFLSLPL